MTLCPEWGCQRHLFYSSCWTDTDCFHLCSTARVFALNFGWSCLKSKNRNNNNNKQPKEKLYGINDDSSVCFVFHLNRVLFNDVYVWGFLCLLVIQSDIKQNKCCDYSLGGERELTLFFSRVIMWIAEIGHCKSTMSKHWPSKKARADITEPQNRCHEMHETSQRAR